MSVRSSASLGTLRIDRKAREARKARTTRKARKARKARLVLQAREARLVLQAREARLVLQAREARRGVWPRVAPRRAALCAIAWGFVACATPLPAVEPSPVPASTPAPPAPTSVVAVFDLEDATGRVDEKARAQLGDYLATQIARVPGFSVVPRDQLRAALLETKAASYEACYEQACQIELGKAVSAKKSLATKLLGLGSTCALTAGLFDLKTETTERAASTKTECREDALFAAIDELVRQLGGRALDSPASVSGRSAPSSGASEAEVPASRARPEEEPPLELRLDESTATAESTPRSVAEVGGREAPELPLDVRWSFRSGRKLLALPEPIRFDRESDDLDEGARRLLRAVARAMRHDPRLARERLELAGHADARERGKIELSERRARRVRAFLVDQGVPVSQLSLRVAGDSEPLVRRGGDKIRALNRRVDILVATED